MPNDINLEDLLLGRFGSSIRFAFPSSIRDDMMCRNLLILFNSITHIISFTEYVIVSEEEPGLPSMEIERGEEKPGPTRGRRRPFSVKAKVLFRINSEAWEILENARELGCGWVDNAKEELEREFSEKLGSNTIEIVLESKLNDK